MADFVKPIVDELVDEIVAEIAPGARVARRPFAYATSARLEELDITRADGRTLSLLAKFLGRDAMTDAARRAKPEALACSGRELAVYRDILAGAALDTPELAGYRPDDGRGNAVIVIERVAGVPLAEIGDFAVWKAAARWLARMHATFATAPRRVSTLVQYDGDLLARGGRHGLERAGQQRLGPPEVLVALSGRHEYALRALATPASTLLHGDFYPSNIVVAGDRIAVVDWELAGHGPGVLDLAALASGSWSGEQRHDLVRAYHEEIGELGRPTETLTALSRRVELASLNLALRWVGAAPDWEAPEQHRRDWFGDAVAALDRLDRGLP